MASEHAQNSDYQAPPPLIEGDETYGTINDRIGGIVLEQRHPLAWLAIFAVGSLLVMAFLTSTGYLLIHGVGVWGINIPVAWGWAIINLVWWIGIGHAGTLISAILLLFHQDWRTSINRFAETMTIFAVMMASLFPLLHLGRPWLFYFIMPYPSTLGMWPQFRSPLVWDVFAINTYATVSALFWFIGIIPDVATLRDRAKNRFAKIAYGIAALGWRGSARHWFRYETVYIILAGLATPLVVSVHSIVSFDFAVSLLPGWHTTVFPPYFVAGAVFSGFAMVLTLTIPLRKMYNLENYITMRHINNMAKVMLATGLVVAYGYAMEFFTGWYSGHDYEQFMLVNRLGGYYAPAFWMLILCNVITPQLLWFSNIRSNLVVLFVISLAVNLGMWLERYVIVVTSLHADFLPSSWGVYHGTIWDWLLFIGTIGLFLTMLLVFLRILPSISMFEMRHLHHKLMNHGKHHD